MQETWVQSRAWEDSLEEGMATHSSNLAWKLQWTEEPGGLQSIGSESRTRLSDQHFHFHFFQHPHHPLGLTEPTEEWQKPTVGGARPQVAYVPAHREPLAGWKAQDSPLRILPRPCTQDVSRKLHECFQGQRNLERVHLLSSFISILQPRISEKQPRN